MKAVDDDQRGRLAEIAALFLRLGMTGFGGPAAHIAMMEDEVVRRRRWLTHGEFLDLVGATNLIPGPNSTEMAIHLGFRRASWPGLFLAGVCFILPAAMIVGGLAWAYVRFGRLPQVAGMLDGVKPIMIAIVLQALWGLGRTAVKTRTLAVAALGALTLYALGMNELALLLVTGLVVAIADGWKRAKPGTAFPLLLASISQVPATMAAGAGLAVTFGLWPLFLFFLKVGSVLFGSGYVLLAFLRADLVERWHWLSEGQLLDAIVVGQITPGPVFTTATFIGGILGGVPGACVATIGIFLPAFFFVAISGPLVPWLRQSPWAGAFLDGVNVASLVLMAIVTWNLGKVAISDGFSVALALASGALLFRYRVNSAWLVLGGASLGLMLR